MNVYDFDKTIYDHDSTWDFYKYTLKRHPSVLKYILKQGMAALKYVLKIWDKTRMKEVFYLFLREIDDIDREVEEFWDSHEKYIHKWYLDQRREDDVVISASPEFIIKSICSRLGVKYAYASKVDKKTGKYDGINCHDVEKASVFREHFPEGEIDRSYSDSYSDHPLAKLAKESFLVKGETLEPWKF